MLEKAIQDIVKCFSEYDRANYIQCKKIKKNIDAVIQVSKKSLTGIFNNLYRFDRFEGPGNMPICPFFSIFLKKTDWSHKKGFYVAFLFDKKIENVYLTLLFGTENLSLKEVSTFSEKFRQMLELPNPTIDLRSSSSRPKKYVNSTLYSKRYNIENFKREFKLSDLEYVLKIYQRIYEVDIFESILLEKELLISETLKTHNRKISKDELKRINEYRKLIGDKGEEFALKIENEKLQKSNIALKAKIISNDNEAAGYDILSFNSDKSSKFIEVKTTVSTSYNFFISSAEKLFMERNKDNYHLYFINDFDPYNCKGKLSTFTYKDIKEMKFEPVKFKVSI